MKFVMFKLFFFFFFLKCAINDALIGSQSDKVLSLIGVCIEARIS